METEVNVRGCD